jgi:NAD(P)-dependent dehydrogenase (short-subunit alcohol dehydrogenase family)
MITAQSTGPGGPRVLKVDLCIIATGSAPVTPKVDDVARAAVWLASDSADYITGAPLFVNGGMSLYPAFRDNG